MVRRCLRIALISLLMPSCSQNEKALTQLMLVADTDVANLDAVRFLVVAEDGSHQDHAFVMRMGDAPITVNLVREQHTLGPLTITAQGIQAERSTPLVQRVQRVNFVANETRVVKLHLVEDCIAKQCMAGQTCSETGCTAIDVPSDALDRWTGAPPRLANADLDAGVPPQEAGARDGGRDSVTPNVGDARVAEPDASDGGRDAGSDAGTDVGSDAGSEPNLTQCDGGAYSLKTDPYHCGLSCGTAQQCDDGVYSNTIKDCVNGTCNSCFGTLCGSSDLRCKRGYGDCSSTLGCETNLTTSTSHCGACDKACATGQTCVAGVCQ